MVSQNLEAVLEGFCLQCNQNSRLREMNRDWDRVVAITSQGEHATPLWIVCRQGELTLHRHAPGDEADLEVEAPEEVLRAVFSGQLSPTEPYNRGELMVRGSSDDLMRLDIITLLLWGD